MKRAAPEPPRTDEETAALFTAARGFLVGEWFGALLMVASYAQLYAFVFAGSGVAPRTSLLVGLGLLTLGTYVFLRSRSYYQSLGFPWKRRWEAAAVVVAGSGAVFWLLFALLVVLVWQGVPVR